MTSQCVTASGPSAQSRFARLSFENATALTASVAERWLHTLLKQDARRSYCVALSGGRIAMDFFEALVQEARAHRALLDNVHFFWADERCVPSDSPESNFRVAHQLLFEPLKIADSHIHRIRTEEAPERSAHLAAEPLRAVADSSNGLPVFDMIFLGMGEDGHVASLFPDESSEVMNQAAIYRAVTAAKPPPKRITLGYGTIVAAREVWVLASGKGKQAALAESLSPNGDTPLSRVIRSRKQTLVFTDIA
jgi:6-phosphogluconolactonase